MPRTSSSRSTSSRTSLSRSTTSRTSTPKVSRTPAIRSTAPRKSTTTQTTTVKSVNTTSKNHKNNNYSYGSKKESQVGDYLVKQFGGSYTKSPGSRTASDIQYYVGDKKIFDIQVKASRPSSSGSNKVSITEKKELCKISSRDGSIPLCVEMKGNNAKFEVLK